MCGKNAHKISTLLRILGSPPRVREKRPEFLNRMQVIGITPACAGKTKGDRGLQGERGDHPRVCGKNRLCVVHLDCCLADHPRVCGKNLVAYNNVLMRLGSPPRVREKQKGIDWTLQGHGITPACAGKTLKGPNEIKTFLSF